MEEALYEIASMCQFADLSLTNQIPDETAILNFRRLLETFELAPETLARVNGYLSHKGHAVSGTAVPGSCNASGSRGLVRT